MLLITLDSGLAWDLSPLPSLLFLLKRQGQSYACSTDYTLETSNAFDFTGSRQEGNLPQIEIIMQSHGHPT